MTCAQAAEEYQQSENTAVVDGRLRVLLWKSVPLPVEFTWKQALRSLLSTVHPHPCC